MSPLTKAAYDAGGLIRTISASRPSSLKKPLFCARGRVRKLPTGAGYPTLILSAAWTEACRNKNAIKAPKNFFIGYLRVSRSQSLQHNSNVIRARRRALARPGIQAIPNNLIIMKAMYTVTAVLSRLDRGGDTLWKTLHWTFTSITPGHEWKTVKAESCMQVGWLIAVGASRTSFSDGLPVLRWQSRRWGTGTGWSMRSKRAAE